MSGRVAVVTGGASGIGGAIAARLASDGHAVAVFDLDKRAAEQGADAIVASGGTAIGVAVDVSDRAAIDAGADRVRRELGAPSILVNSAGMTTSGPFLDISAGEWARVLAVNLTGTFDCCQAILPDMVEQGWGRIVNISSSSIHSGAAGMAAYVSSKSGVLGLTKVLALEFARRGITVNTIPPGFIDTPMMRATADRGFIDVQKAIDATPVGRVGLPEDIAAACAFLVSEEAGYITGQVIGVNGGRNT
ncbi:SDR family NAD(P)-dependent oxidoreductase [Nocardia vermiculata]|uniref:3-oxoacyl-[acyl-carrier-protein] reductase MabA n=1 Tax=Nocardia vermiculata TaxID=257274 RepID=A0A846XYF6_9NOCA|nr:3-oxoacyl-ACP reductase FabG [Nocardia vermiculata]NKY50932.1 3-oxoacyl-ACP reductase FabG [Nocardia vermiculata]